MAISSINFQKSKSHSVAETTREFKAKYLLPEKFRKTNEYWNYKNSSDIKNIDLDFFNEELSKANRKGGKIPKFENSSWEAVLNLNDNHNIDDVKKVLEHIEKKFNIKGTRIAIHKDEGNYNPITNTVEYNYHAHLNFVTYKDGKQNWRLAFVNKDKLRDLQTEVAEILEMERGEFNSKSVRANHRVLRDNYEEIIEDREAKKEALEYKNKNMKNVIKGREIIKDERSQKQILKAELEKLKEENKLLRTELQNNKSERTAYAELEALNKKLKSDLENGSKNFDSVKQELVTFKDKYLKVKNELHLVKCNEIVLIEELKELKLEVYSSNWELENKPMKYVAVVEYLQDENMKINESLKKIQDLKLELQELNKKLESDLTSLQEQNRALEDKVTDLQEKINFTPNMSDYEQIKKENVELKKENSILSRMFNNAAELINSQIERLLGTGKMGRTKKYTKEEARDMAEYQIKNNNTPVTPVAKKEDYDYSNDWGMQR